MSKHVKQSKSSGRVNENIISLKGERTIEDKFKFFPSEDARKFFNHY